MVDLSRVCAPSIGLIGQYDPTECWSDRRSPMGTVIGKCPHLGKADLDGLCEVHYEEIFGEAA